ncbi:MAG: FmdB family zinc ribbon protein [Planctomycetota bacterium]|jgi:phage FluMu protein Com
MPIEFRCTECGRLLRTADDAAGLQARCPECEAIMVIPVPRSTWPADLPSSEIDPTGRPTTQPYDSRGSFAPGVAPPSESRSDLTAYAAARTAGPGVALVVTGSIGLALHGIGALLHALRLALDLDFPFTALPPFHGSVAVLVGLLGIVPAVVVILGGIQMKNLESYGLAMVASVIAVIPCVSPCCLLGFPVGIWAVVELCDPRVQAAFRSMGPR